MAKCLKPKCKRKVLPPSQYCYSCYDSKAFIRRTLRTRRDEGWDDGVLTKLIYSPEELESRHREKWWEDLLALAEDLDKRLAKL
jgi:hypothetical protein